MTRSDNRRANDLRPVTIRRGYTNKAPGSIKISCGDTVVLCTACFEQGVPPWRKDQGLGWVTAEYDMLPASTHTRRSRNRAKVDGRTQEIQRLIGRSLRSVVDMAALGENSILVDCDVLQADGGTRTASITGAYVAVCDAVRVARRNGWIKSQPVREPVAAVSVGVVNGRVLLDLDYREDVDAAVDMNVVMTGAGRFIEVQGTGEEATFSMDELDRLLRLAKRGIKRLVEAQAKALRQRL